MEASRPLDRSSTLATGLDSLPRGTFSGARSSYGSPKLKTSRDGPLSCRSRMASAATRPAPDMSHYRTRTWGVASRNVGTRDHRSRRKGVR